MPDTHDMPSGPGPVYEVTIAVDREIAAAFDEWLAGYVRDMLELPGFVRASTFVADADAPERVGRVTQYVLETQAALEDYLAGPASTMRQSAADRFEGRYTVSRRVLHHAASTEPDPELAAACLNCGAPLKGQYCALCGQRARGRLISIWELIRDAFGDLFELDSRLWRTIIPLMARPGLLTREYLMGRRVRFMPPFRTYLVLSIVFFLVAFFDPQQKLAILYEPSPETAATGDERPRSAEEIRDEIYDDLEEEGIVVARPPEDSPDQDPDLNVRLSRDGSSTVNCDFDDYDADNLPLWLSRRLTRERLEIMCERVSAGGGRAFFDQMLDNVPAALFLLLPLMALILKMLYPLSKRYYVEHLLFVLHFHAFFFLILTLQVLFSRLTALAGLPVITNLTAFVVSLYIPLYLYKSMRRVYEQGRLITIMKYLVLVFSYLLGTATIMVFAAFYTAFSI